jgi:hypothetical protein
MTGRMTKKNRTNSGTETDKNGDKGKENQNTEENIEKEMK